MILSKGLYNFGANKRLVATKKKDECIHTKKWRFYYHSDISIKIFQTRDCRYLVLFIPLILDKYVRRLLAIERKSILGHTREKQHCSSVHNNMVNNVFYFEHNGEQKKQTFFNLTAPKVGGKNIRFSCQKNKNGLLFTYLHNIKFCWTSDSSGN